MRESKAEAHKWVYDTNQGPVNYEKYAHPVAKPGPVISAKTGHIKTAHEVKSAKAGGMKGKQPL